MPITIFDIHGQNESESVVHLSVEVAGGRYERRVTRSKIDTPLKLANWLLAQPVSTLIDDEGVRRRLVVTWHTEEQIDAVAQVPVTVRVIDSVEVEPVAEESTWDTLLASPLGTVTLGQADNAVDAISNLAEAKTYLKRLNAVVLAERDTLSRILELLKVAGVR